jgi:hypothetical protein
MRDCIVFELCNVIFDMDYSHFYQILSELNYDPVMINNYMGKNIKLDRFGIFSIRNTFEYDFDPIICNDLLRAWNDVPKLNIHMLKFLEDLSLKVDIIFLSDIGEEHLNKIRSDYPELMELAKIQHMSCEVGTIKSKKLFYQSLFMNNKYNNYYYFDDKQEKLDVFYDSICSLNNMDCYNIKGCLLSLKDLNEKELIYKIDNYKYDIKNYLNNKIIK